MDEYAVQLLKIQAVSALRQDENVARQGVMNHQIAAHLMDMAFIRDQTEVSVPEAYAMQGLSMAQGTREAQANRTAIHIPTADKAA